MHRPILTTLSTLLLTSLLMGCVTLEVEENSLSLQEQQQNLDSFDVLWQTVHDKVWDTTFNGKDWKALGEQYRPLVAQAKNNTEARVAMQTMLNELELSHLNIMPADLQEDLAGKDGGDPSALGSTGLTVRVHRGKAFVTAVDPESPVAKFRIQPGWLIDAIDGRPVQPMLERIQEVLHVESLAGIYMARAIEKQLDGPQNETVEVLFDTVMYGVALVDLPRQPKKGNLVTLGNMPPLRVHMEEKTVAEEIGYVTFNFFMDPLRLMPAMEQAVKKHQDRRGMIVDLRGNGGGIAGVAMGLAGWFAPDDVGHLGTMQFRDTELRLQVNPRIGAYTGPVAILVDNCSASCAEFFAGGLQSMGYARVFGTQTAGAALPASLQKLPNGDTLMFPVADYISESGDRIEGVGIRPDTVIVPGYFGELESPDPVLDAAIAWINEQSPQG